MVPSIKKCSVYFPLCLKAQDQKLENQTKLHFKRYHWSKTALHVLYPLYLHFTQVFIKWNHSITAEAGWIYAPTVEQKSSQGLKICKFTQSIVLTDRPALDPQCPDSYWSDSSSKELSWKLIFNWIYSSLIWISGLYWFKMVPKADQNGVKQD